MYINPSTHTRSPFLVCLISKARYLQITLYVHMYVDECSYRSQASSTFNQCDSLDTIEHPGYNRT